MARIAPTTLYAAPPGRLSGSGKAIWPSRRAAALRTKAWVSVSSATFVSGF